MAKPKQTYSVTGKITDMKDNPLSGLLVRAFYQDPQTPENPLGESAITDAQGRYKIVFTEKDFRIKGMESGGPDIFIRAFDGGQLLGESSVKRNTKKQLIIDLRVTYVRGKAYTVTGGVYTSKLTGAAHITVQVMDIGVGTAATLAQTQTDAYGQFNGHFNYPAGKKDKPDIQVVAVDSLDLKKILGRSELHYAAESAVKIDVVLPAAHDPLPINEFQRMSTALAKHIDHTAFKDLREEEGRADISYLAQKTGIDARLVAMVALAHEYGEKNNLPPELFYALFRAGQPADAAGINRISAATAQAVFKTAIQNNLISADHRARIDEYVHDLESTAIDFVLSDKGKLSVSSMGELLALSLPEKEAQQTFARLYRENYHNLPKFWRATAGQLGEEKTDRLRLDGKLGLLTQNNAPLIQKLKGAGLLAQGPVELVRKGFYKTASWNALLTPEISIPQNISGANDLEKRANYAAAMTMQLRLSYPTAILAQQIGNNEIILNVENSIKSSVIQFLDGQKGSFEMGKTPVARFIKDNHIKLHPDNAIHVHALTELKRLERVYQISPSDLVMSVLLKNNLDSAFSIANKYDEPTFVLKYAADMGGENAARLTYAKSSMVAASVVNVALAYGTYRKNPPVYAINAGHGLHQDAPGSDDVIVNPTLEELFGEMDYCECEHCRSVLSPAAYLVDLLKFIDRDENLAGKENPYEVLRRRRPDIEYIQLTCENTNTVLPYIDLVNEIQEHHVVHGNLTAFTGYNVEEGEKSEDLLANPQFVNETAYQILTDQVYPIELPFNLHLETLRVYFEHLKMPLWEAMKLLRTDDSMTSPGLSPLAPYGWNEIYSEYLGLSPQLTQILTANVRTLAEYYGEPAGVDLNAVLAAENDYARKLTRKLGITYKELVAIVKTRFINPHADLIDKLEKLQVGLPVLISYIDSNGANDFALPAGIDASRYDGDVKAWLLKQDAARGIDNPAHIRSLILVSDPAGDAADCNFVPLQLRYADQSLLRSVEYWKLLRFVRLWKALGWAIEQTDIAINALYPTSSLPGGADTDAQAIQKLNQGFSDLIARLAQAKTTMERLNMNVTKNLAQLLSFWTDIDTYGTQSLYRQLFLSPAIKKIDAVFEDDGYGQYLQDNTQHLSDHLPALLAAFNINEESFSRVSTTLAIPDTLTLSNLSLLHRYAALSRFLRISIRELLVLRKLSGLNDPFSNIGAVPNSTIRLIEMVEHIKAAGLKIPQLNYLLTHEDPGGKASPVERDMLAFAKMVRTVLSLVEQDNREGIADPDGTIARAKLMQAYGQEAANQFFGLIEGTTIFQVEYDHTATALEPAIKAISSRIAYDDVAKKLSFDGSMNEGEKTAYLDIAGTSMAFKDAIALLYAAQGSSETPYTHNSPVLEDAILEVSSRIAYDDFAKRLVFQGVMTPAEQAAFKTLGMPALFNTAIDVLFSQTRSLFGLWPALGDLYQHYFAALGPVSRKASFGSILAWLLPILKSQLKRLAVREQLRDALSVETDVLIALAETPAVLLASDGVSPLISDFYGTETGQGFTEDTPAAGQKRLRAYLEAPVPQFFNFYIETDAASVNLQVGPINIPGTLDAGVWSNDVPLSLKPGELVLFQIILTGTANTPVVQWATSTLAKGIIPPKNLYAFGAIDIFQNAYMRLLKSLALVEKLELKPAEIRHFSQFTITVGGNPVSVNWLNAILVPTQTTPASVQDVFTHFQRILAYTRLRKALQIDGENLVAILKNPQQTNEEGENLLLKYTGWTAENRDALLQRMGWVAADLSDVLRLYRLNEAYTAIRQTGLSASQLLNSAVVSPTPALVRDLQAGLRARYDAASWREVIQPLNDRLRVLQRDALTAYVLHQMSLNAATAHISTGEKLFEYFLIDVKMDSCMKTSRIKQALSSIQLFIHRCLLNLEKNVSPGSLNARQWDWMKRYRVWEANRKVFLWPENWLEPELRDNKSSFFRELESELLQSDITEESAATALFNYLEKLDNIAKLEICALYVQENEIAKNGEYYTADDIVHVFGRTPGANRRYYYRRFEYGYWTPWDKMDLDIEDNPILPVVWKDRLLLFWLNLIQKGNENSNFPVKNGANSDKLIDATLDSTLLSSDSVTEATLSWSEYFNGKWQPRRTSDFSQPVTDLFSGGNMDRNAVYLKPEEGNEGELIINVWDRDKFSFFNKHSTPSRIPVWFSMPNEGRDRAFVNGITASNLTILYNTIRYGNGLFGYTSHEFTHDILLGNPGVSVFSRQLVKGNLWENPFFFQNARHVFYVETDESIYKIPTYNGYGVFNPVNSEPYVPHIPDLWAEPAIPVLVPDIDPVIRYPDLVTDPPRDPLMNTYTDRLSQSNIHQALVQGQTFSFRGVYMGARGPVAVPKADLQFRFNG